MLENLNLPSLDPCLLVVFTLLGGHAVSLFNVGFVQKVWNLRDRLRVVSASASLLALGWLMARLTFEAMI